MQVTPAGHVIIGIKWAKVVLLLLGGLALTTAAVWSCMVPPGVIAKPLWYLHTIGWIGAVFFALCTMLLARRLLSRGPGLVIDGSGIVDQTSYLSAGRVRWQDIRGTRLISMRGQKLIVIDVHDPQQFVDRGNVLQRWLKAINMRMVGSPVLLNLTSLDARADEILAGIDRYFDRATGRRVSPPGP